MRRVIVAGGTGFFGRAALEMLQHRGIRALAASRRSGADVQFDVEDAPSLRAALRPGDLVIDTVGPFQDRTTTLLAAAIEIGCDVVDISDSLSYAQRVFALRKDIAAAGIRVLPSCSSVSTVTALLVANCGIATPVRASGFLVPSARYSASAATADSLLHSIGQVIHVWRNGRLEETRGWTQDRQVTLPEPIGSLHGWLFESADSFWLPQIWPSLQVVELYVDTRIPGLNGIFSLAARAPLVRRLIECFQPAGHRLARRLGRRDSCLAVEVEGATGQIAHRSIYCPDRGYRLAVLPAVLAVEAVFNSLTPQGGLVVPDCQIDLSHVSQAIHEAGYLVCENTSLDT
jgi:hypothetical protein